MATPSEKLAESLEALKGLQEKGITAIKSAQLSRVHRERLVKNGFLKEVTKGWYMAAPADEPPGDSTSWYASYWQFCAEYLAERYGDDYFISPEQSLLIHTGNRTVPAQLIIRTSRKANHSTPLPHGTSLWHWESAVPSTVDIISLDGLRIYSLPSALIHCTPTIFKTNPADVRAALGMIKDASELTTLLLQGGHSTIAGRLAGAFRNIGRDRIADDIVKTMQAAGYDVRETYPFENKSSVAILLKETSPYVNRLKLIWHQMRPVVIENFPAAPGIPADHDAYMQKVEELYVADAYHSLSIERYRVTPALIDRVRTGDWDSAGNQEDKKQKDAMAARGYWQATQKVRDSLRKILGGANAGRTADEDHSEWYRELFAPSVAAGIINAASLAGYRSQQVFISSSRHVPVHKDGVRDMMPAFFELLEAETEASVRVVLGHFLFVYIHPYMDGNGRMGRFLMNTMLASGGYPWTVIPVEQRQEYMQALEQASVEMNITPFTKFIVYLVGESIKGRPVAGE